MKNKKSRKMFFLIIFIILFIFAAPYVLEFLNINISTNSSIIGVSVPQGSSTLEIGQILKQNHLIKSKYIFAFKVKNSQYNNKLNYGIFKLKKNMSINEIIKIIGENKYSKKTYSITIPEGYSAEQIALLFEKNGYLKSGDFINALSDTYDYEFIKYIPEGNYKYKLQGFLFPSTYEFYTSSDAHEVINRMLSEFSKRYKHQTNSFENVFNIITKASIIEKEAKLESERPIIAGVIENRLEKNMLLQIDACVVYAATEGKYDDSSIYKSDLQSDSPYNTYKYPSLPAGPISNPGISSISAALNPQKNDYLYYHTDEEKKDGSHIFTNTFENHLDTMK